MATATFTTSGTWQCPAGVSAVQVECWGQGGNGGSGHNLVSSTYYGGAGGGGGAYAKTNAMSVRQGKTYTVQVGDSNFTGESGSCTANSGGNGNGISAGAGGIATNGDTLVNGGPGGGLTAGYPNPGGGGGGCGNGNTGAGKTSFNGGIGGTGANGGGNGGNGGIAELGPFIGINAEFIIGEHAPLLGDFAGSLPAFFVDEGHHFFGDAGRLFAVIGHPELD